MSWLRLWHEMPTDPKWRVIARRSGRPISEVISVFTLMLVTAGASASERGAGGPVRRGFITSWQDEVAGAALDIDAEAVRAIRDAMQGLVLDGDRLTGWESRQPKREDNSAERVRRHRDQRKDAVTQDNAEKRIVTQGNARKTDHKDHTEKQTDRQRSCDAGDAKPAPPPKRPPADHLHTTLEVADALGLPVAEITAELNQRHPKNRPAYLVKICVNRLRAAHPRIPDQTCRDALVWRDSKAIEAIQREIYAKADASSANYISNPSTKIARQ